MSNTIVSTLMRLGPSSADVLAKSLDVSQSQISRLIASSGLKITRVGGSKNTIYAAVRAVRQLQDHLTPVFKIAEDGSASLFGKLSSIHPEAFLFHSDTNTWPLETRNKAHFYSMPYFIQDAKPQGFMGRNFAKDNSASLSIPDNPSHWTDDDILVAMSIMGEDLPGDLIVGEASYQRFLEKILNIIEESDINSAYLDLASEALSSGSAGSSAGGEFPKFTATRVRNESAAHVIVKFSGNGDSPSERRWSDLLRCEAHASSSIASVLNVESSASLAFSSGGRTFMESVRFDRVGLHGRKPMCSLSSIDAELIGMGNPQWDKIADNMMAMNIINSNVADVMVKVWFFGKLIGNTDMHAGNLSFKPTGNGKLELCPIYDMLPMIYAPLRGVEVLKDVQVNIYKPIPGREDLFKLATEAAKDFWIAVSNDAEISIEFREIAEEWSYKLKSESTPKPF